MGSVNAQPQPAIQLTAVVASEAGCPERPDASHEEVRRAERFLGEEVQNQIPADRNYRVTADRVRALRAALLNRTQLSERQANELLRNYFNSGDGSLFPGHDSADVQTALRGETPADAGRAEPQAPQHETGRETPDAFAAQGNDGAALAQMAQKGGRRGTPQPTTTPRTPANPQSQPARAGTPRPTVPTQAHVVAPRVPTPPPPAARPTTPQPTPPATPTPHPVVVRGQTQTGTHTPAPSGTPIADAPAPEGAPQPTQAGQPPLPTGQPVVATRTVIPTADGNPAPEGKPEPGVHVFNYGPKLPAGSPPPEAQQAFLNTAAKAMNLFYFGGTQQPPAPMIARDNTGARTVAEIRRGSTTTSRTGRGGSRSTGGAPDLSRSTALGFRRDMGYA